MDDWNDLRLVLAIARNESLTGAARDLGVNHSTAFRRLGVLEEAIGVRLFERLPGGVYTPTQAGERMAATAERIETETVALDREIVGRDRSLTGRLRVTSSETLAFRILTKQIARFRRIHPGIVVELVIDSRLLSLSRREADVALRVARPREGDLHGRKLSDIAWTLYGSRDLVGNAEPAADLSRLTQYPVIGWEESMTGISAADWMAEHVPSQAFVYRTNSIVNQLVAAKTGMGIAALPCYLGDPEPDLIRLIGEPIPELTRELWIVTHADLRRTARVRAFFEVVGEGLAAERSLLTGLSPSA
ncbi:LysR family transcriptional regulator [Microvirga rosea]|uniref:LysR family transcriptional regulator n=1 Tax=Microvirga rosea TaxID=2715425 RepID=UPI001D0A74B3|nr:LysR family transcriptional regulator [Microvirga rosea]MCB8820113.1 LysR family transcriptional regulator [Microvirga rosea]